MSQITFTVYSKPEPQGSMKAHVRNGRAHLTSDNKKLNPFRHTVTQVARMEMSQLGLEEPMAKKHVAVEMTLEFTLLRPGSIPKRRIWPVVKPDSDKLARSVLDSLTGVLYADDAQVVVLTVRKQYGPVEQVHVSARIVTEKA